MKIFVKAINREGSGFAFLQGKFLRISMQKLKADIFDSPQIRELIKEPMFDEALSETELSHWSQSLQSVVTTFLGNHRGAEYEKEIEELLKNFRQLGARMSVRLHFLRSHFYYIPNNCGDSCEELIEWFH